MVKEIENQGRKVYQCEECEFLYEDKDWADKCEEWCRENHSCNMEIIKHAVKIK